MEDSLSLSLYMSAAGITCDKPSRYCLAQFLLPLFGSEGGRSGRQGFSSLIRNTQKLKAVWELAKASYRVTVLGGVCPRSWTTEGTAGGAGRGTDLFVAAAMTRARHGSPNNCKQDGSMTFT